MQIQAAFLVGGFIDPLEQTPPREEVGLDALVSTFIDKQFDWDRIRQHCVHFHVFHSDNDPYTLLPRAENIGKMLRAEMHTLKNRGHFNETVFLG